MGSVNSSSSIAGRFTGCPSARVTTLGGRYDYHFDAHDRLLRADYIPREADSGEDFSARYIYDDLYRPRRVVRRGVVNRTEDNAEEFGVLDDLIYTYDGSRLQSIAYDSDGMEYYGRPGYPGVEAGEYTWNDAGLMTSDSVETPEGQPLLYQGKERLASTGDHDFGARVLATPTLLWRQPDPMAHDYLSLSPYTFCAANPIRYSDQTGMYLMPVAREAAANLIATLWDKAVEDLMSKNQSTMERFVEVFNEIKEMDESNVMFDVEYEDDGRNYGTTTYKSKHTGDVGAVVFTLPSGSGQDLVAHEFKHGYQFIKGQTCLAVDEWDNMGTPLFYDVTDEMAAYDRGALFGGDRRSREEIMNKSLYAPALPGKMEASMYRNLQLNRIKNNAYQRAVYLNGQTYFRKSYKHFIINSR